MPTSSRFRLAATALGLTALLARPAAAQRPVELAPNAPQDRAVTATRRCQVAAVKRAIAPIVATARASFPAAAQRFRAGLPERHTFFATTVLRDSDAREEQVFIAVDSIVGQGDSTRIAGRIWSQIGVVRGYQFRQPHTFPVADLMDWMIARPDGTEEGNEVGKFLERYTPPAVCSDPVGTR
jgi:hypothetical protein